VSGHPFDGAAATYDRDFTATALGRLHRERVWRVLDRALPRGGRLLDLGCGTGEDALWLLGRGAERVVGCDASSAMLETARAKAAAAGLGGRLSLHRLDLARVDTEPPPPGTPFDGALANFGVLNCLPDRRPTATAVASWLAPGAPLVVVIMGPWCAWEVAWHLLRGDPRAALRRRRQGAEVRLPGGGRLPVWYPSPAVLRRELAADFEPAGTVGIGAFLPPPYLDRATTRRPRLLATLGRLETRLAGRWPWSHLADHLAMVFRRRRSGNQETGPGG
jgi:SAM-dependent methyltransferase